MQAEDNEEEERRKLMGKAQEMLVKYKVIKGGSGSQKLFDLYHIGIMCCKLTIFILLYPILISFFCRIMRMSSKRSFQVDYPLFGEISTKLISC